MVIGKKSLELPTIPRELLLLLEANRVLMDLAEYYRLMNNSLEYKVNYLLRELDKIILMYRATHD